MLPVHAMGERLAYSISDNVEWSRLHHRGGPNMYEI